MTQSVWDIAIQQSKAKGDTNCQNETTLLFVGNKSSGKSTIINYFLDKEEKLKPTLALDYTFGRKGTGNYLNKSVSHIWELGGGCKLADLINVVITPGNVLKLNLILVLDLSKPTELWHIMEILLNTTVERIEQMLNRLKQRDLTQIQSNLTLNMEKRITSNHPDRELLNPFPIPLTIIGNKYDLFTNLNLEQQKVVCKTLRFLNHYRGANLYFVSHKEDALMRRLKTYLNHIAFGSSDARNLQTEMSKPLSIPVGMDSFSNIGAPPNLDMEMGRLTAKTPLEMWKNVFCSKFPQVSGSVSLSNASYAHFSEVCDPTKDPQYAEPILDQARKSKDEEFEVDRRQRERRMYTLLQQVTSEGLLIA